MSCRNRTLVDARQYMMTHLCRRFMCIYLRINIFYCILYYNLYSVWLISNYLSYIVWFLFAKIIYIKCLHKCVIIYCLASASVLFRQLIDSSYAGNIFVIKNIIFTYWSFWHMPKTEPRRGEFSTMLRSADAICGAFSAQR